jgi:hypothetical protein
MTLLEFHLALLGLVPEDTPEQYRPTDAQKEFYAAYEEYGILGVSSTTPSRDIILGTFVLALRLTMPPEVDQPIPVRLLISKHIEKETVEVIKKTSAYIFAARKDMLVSDCKMVYDAICKLAIENRVTNYTQPPERWVALGFSVSSILLPIWLKSKLTPPLELIGTNRGFGVKE